MRKIAIIPARGGSKRIPRKNIKDFFKDHKEVSLALLDSETIKVDDYFDIKENRFSLIGLNEALDKAESECIKIVEERNGKPTESFSEDYQKRGYHQNHPG